jgi:hypothetical protein
MPLKNPYCSWVDADDIKEIENYQKEGLSVTDALEKFAVARGLRVEGITNTLIPSARRTTNKTCRANATYCFRKILNTINYLLMLSQVM